MWLTNVFSQCADYGIPYEKSKQIQHKSQRRFDKVEQVLETYRHHQQEVKDWPTQVPCNIIFNCLDSYRQGTIWVPPPICVACARSSAEVSMVTVENDRQCHLVANNPKPVSLDLDILSIADPYILKCLTQSQSPVFQFHSPAIEHLMLHKQGIVSILDSSAVIQLCPDCFHSLSNHKLPKFALANNIFRGSLPDDLSDITWIEEIVCAIYRNTAHVTRLYGSSDPSHPTVLHGNTCAHEMNVISTAAVLPRTPADVNDMLSIVFIGSNRPTAQALKKLFRVRKGKVMSFLMWLKNYNKLYEHIPIDHTIANQYPDDGVMPGLEERIIVDAVTVPEHLFAEETAGFALHPAAAIRNNDNQTFETAEPMIESMGMSDPEYNRIPGRSFTASALKNLAVKLPGHESLPDLIIKRGSHAVAEYNNSNLMPGMFPTLFRYGIGGFEDKE